LLGILKKEVNKVNGKVFTVDMREYSVALYEGDESFVVRKDFNNLDKYIDKIIDICIAKKVTAIITLIDPELVLLAENKNRFLEKGILPIVSDDDGIKLTFDKYKFAKTLQDKLKVIPTFNGYDEVNYAIINDEIRFPIFAKIRNGSGSTGIGKVDNKEELKGYMDKKNYIFQPYLKEKEYGIDIYFDLVDGKIKSIFIKEKLYMRAGETDKSVSIYRDDIINEMMKLQQFNFRGPIDVDVFEDKEGNLYINEINPRFRGGYPHAYNAGVNFIDMLVKNLNGKVNEVKLGNYKKGLIMMKYSSASFINENEMIMPK